jgi:hypothetical protein
MGSRKIRAERAGQERMQEPYLSDGVRLKIMPF